MVVDATGQIIYCYDLVMLMNSSKSTAAQGNRGMVLRCLPDSKLVLQRVDGASTTEAACDMAVVDRCFLRPGRVVARASDGGGGQVGAVMSTATALDLSDEDGVVVANGVPPAEVRRVRELCLGDYVVVASGWLGRVFKVFLDVDVLFDGGAAVCRVMHADSKQMRTLQKDCLSRRTNSRFYPGQRVVDGIGGDVFCSALWLKGNWKPSNVEGTVSKVHTSAVLVHWVASSLSSSTSHVKKPPPAYQLIDNVTFFCPGDELSSWSVGDRCFFRNTCSSSTNAVVGNNPLFERAMRVTNTHTTVDVAWQDGSRQRGLPSASLIPTVALNWFFPGQRVVVHHVPAGADDDNVNRVGVVRSFSCEDRTVRVAVEECAAEMEFSAYDLKSHDAFYGNIAVRRRQPMMYGGNNLSWVGKVVDLPCDDDVQVKWGDGTTSKVSLDEIVVVKHTYVSEMLQEIGHREATSSAANALYSVTVRMTKWVGAFVQAMFRLVTSKVLVQDTRYQEAAMAEATSWLDDEIAGTDDKEEGTSDVVGEGLPKANAKDEIFNFGQFDVVQSPSDHHYIDTKEMQGISGLSRKWTKRVHKEWKILKNDLPAGTIYVRAFEDRTDLLRVAMVGAWGTPYHDGLFFFDLHLPSSYPDSPPQVSYHSFGLRVNPNLLESGMVCLSLLNTVNGNSTELWSPDSSTLLQVLVSIQGLVLTAHPYYNETGYAAHAGTPVGHRNELPCTENAYLLTLQTMLHLLRRPPLGFEDLVRDHFRRRGHHVLRACEAYLEGGCLVGTLDAEGNATEASSACPCSVGFYLALTNVVSRLVEAFMNIGAEGCEQFNQLWVPPRPGHSVC